MDIFSLAGLHFVNNAKILATKIFHVLVTEAKWLQNLYYMQREVFKISPNHIQVNLVSFNRWDIILSIKIENKTKSINKDKSLSMCICAKEIAVQLCAWQDGI